MCDESLIVSHFFYDAGCVISAPTCGACLGGFMGILAAGGITVGIYTTDSPNQVGYITGHSGAKFFIAEDEEQLDKALFFRERTPDLTKIVLYRLSYVGSGH